MQDFSDYDPMRQGFGFQEPAPKKRSGVWIVVAIVGTISVLCIGLCCGGFVWLMSFGLNILGEQVAEQLRDNPVILEHIGQIQTCDVDFSKSAAHADEDTMVYKIEGTKGKGELVAQSESTADGNEIVIWAELRLPSGEKIEVPID